MSERSRRVLVTGASGFIGRQTLAPLAARGFEVYALTRGDRTPDGAHHRVAGDLLAPDGAASIVAEVRPSHLLHLAWDVAPGRFWTAEENLDWVEASLRLLRAFRRHGGRRVVSAGTCAEYHWGGRSLSEATTPLQPATLYGASKLALAQIQAAYAERFELGAAWGRVFFVHGPHEDPRRLVSSVARSLLLGEVAETSEGSQLRDFLDTPSLGDAFAAVVDSEVEGPLNLARGESVSIRSVVELLGELTGAPDLLRIGARPTSPTDPSELSADVSRLRNEVGWTPPRTLRDGLEETVAWWRQELAGPR